MFLRCDFGDKPYAEWQIFQDHQVENILTHKWWKSERVDKSMCGACARLGEVDGLKQIGFFPRDSFIRISIYPLQ